eukprot:Amastigsp_a841017_609.p2 type:complete len:293 gc:universal Amastigsp_a841017_609:1-879(+)
MGRFISFETTALISMNVRVFTDQTSSSSRKTWLLLGGISAVVLIFYMFMQRPASGNYSLSKEQAMNAKPMSFSQCFKQELFADVGDFNVHGAALLFEDKALDKNSIVFVVGGRAGHFVQTLYEEYECSIFVFEAVPSVFKELEAKFAGNPKIRVFNYYLGNSDTTMAHNANAPAHGNDNANTEYGNAATPGEPASHVHNSDDLLEIHDIARTIKELSIRQVHMLHIDCKGCEYDLVEYILEKSNRIQEIQVSFATSGVESPLVRYCRIQEELSGMFTLLYRYPFVFESWRRK